MWELRDWLADQWRLKASHSRVVAARRLSTPNRSLDARIDTVSRRRTGGVSNSSRPCRTVDALAGVNGLQGHRLGEDRRLAAVVVVVAM